MMFGRKPMIFLAKHWGTGAQALLKILVGITYEIQGTHHIPKSGSYIFACKHQSAWDTTMIQLLSYDSAFILKRELFWIPIFGQVIKVAGAIGINRSKGRTLMSNLKDMAAREVRKGRPLFIFPEGTRGQPGKPGKYHSGVYALAQHLDLPVIPAALNSGYFWPRRGFLKYPGHIVVKILPPLSPKLSHVDFMHQLKESIETACQSLPKPTHHQLSITMDSVHELPK